ncbi:VOC family protein [Clostridium pasteurianum]|nr:VOC family protein [Clostridium pasteurianum]
MIKKEKKAMIEESMQLQGIHHLKFTVSDLENSQSFYERAIGARRITAYDHRHSDGSLYAIILEIPGLGTLLELRLNPSRAKKDCGLDPITIAVKDRTALESWIEHFDTVDIEHSSILTALISWLVVFEDPDGRRLRLCTLETHSPEILSDETSSWLIETLTDK